MRRESTDRGLDCSSAAMCLLKPRQTFLFLNELSSSSHYSANSQVKPRAANMKLAARRQEHKHERIKGPVCAAAHWDFSRREIGLKIGTVTLACKGLTEPYLEKTSQNRLFKWLRSLLRWITESCKSFLANCYQLVRFSPHVQYQFSGPEETVHLPGVLQLLW